MAALALQGDCGCVYSSKDKASVAPFTAPLLLYPRVPCSPISSTPFSSSLPAPPFFLLSSPLLLSPRLSSLNSSHLLSSSLPLNSSPHYHFLSPLPSSQCSYPLSSTLSPLSPLPSSVKLLLCFRQPLQSEQQLCEIKHSPY
ncbi:unnamed protein product [Arctogadus glacialis]